MKARGTDSKIHQLKSKTMKILLFFALVSFASSFDSTVSHFESCIKSKSYCEIESVFSAELDLVINGDEEFISTAQEANIKLTGFLKEAEIDNVTKKFVSSSRGKRSKLYICDLKTKANKKFRMTINFINNSGWEIVSIEIEKYSKEKKAVYNPIA